jgi:hypothetical protein
MKRILLATAAALAGMSAGLVQAGTQEQAEASAGAQRMAHEIICAEITAMDSAAVPGVLYFVAGFREGQLHGMVGGPGQSGAGAATAVATGALAGSGEQGGGQEHAAGTDAAGADAGGVAPELAGANEAGGDAQRVPVAGYFEIPVEQTVTACEAAPESPVGDVMDQQRHPSGGAG